MKSNCSRACAMAAVLALTGSATFAQAPTESFPPVANVKQLMLDLIHPSSNDILLAIYRGGPKDEKDWAAVRRSAVTLAEYGNMLMMRGRALHDVPQTISTERVPEGRRFEMSYSRRNFLKAAGCGVALTAIAGDQL